MGACATGYSRRALGTQWSPYLCISRARPLSRVFLKGMAHVYELPKNVRGPRFEQRPTVLCWGSFCSLGKAYQASSSPQHMRRVWPWPAIAWSNLSSRRRSRRLVSTGHELVRRQRVLQEGLAMLSGGCCPPQFRWACDMNRKCYRPKRAALRDGCPEYAVSVCIKPRWAD